MSQYDDPPVLRTMPLAELRQASGLAPTALKDIRAGRSRPRLRNRAALTAITVSEARTCLALLGANVPKDDLAALHAYGISLVGSTRACPECGGPVTSARATYCSARCRKRASRVRRV